jgi:hypothetical protein
MSTRSTTHFTYGDTRQPTAIIYRHADGYPEGAGTDLLRFLDECSKLSDSRFGDPAYLAAKYVVFLADMFNVRYEWTKGKMSETKPESKLEFLSVGVLDRDPGDIEYRYTVNCGKLDEDGKPEVTCFSIYEKREVPIPKPAVAK